MLKAGTIKLKFKLEADQFFDIKGGVIEVLSNKVLILAE
jgi:F0F1-type ATP synthase epsilon subunit